jgi:hypothetical protein
MSVREPDIYTADDGTDEEIAHVDRLHRAHDPRRAPDVVTRHTPDVPRGGDQGLGRGRASPARRGCGPRRAAHPTRHLADRADDSRRARLKLSVVGHAPGRRYCPDQNPLRLAGPDWLNRFRRGGEKPSG